MIFIPLIMAAAAASAPALERLEDCEQWRAGETIEQTTERLMLRNAVDIDVVTMRERTDGTAISTHGLAVGVGTASNESLSVTYLDLEEGKWACIDQR